MCEVCIQRAEGSVSQGHNQKLWVYDLQPCFLIVCIYFKCCHYRSWDREKCGQDSWACCYNTYFVLPRVEPTGWAQHVLTQSRLLKEVGLGPRLHKKTSPDSPRRLEGRMSGEASDSPWWLVHLDQSRGSLSEQGHLEGMAMSEHIHPCSHIWKGTCQWETGTYCCQTCAGLFEDHAGFSGGHRKVISLRDSFIARFSMSLA